jgi:hypothetical protein
MKFKSSVIAKAFAFAIGVGAAPAAYAVPADFSTPLPNNAFIVFQGRMWAWAAPDNGGQFGSSVDLSVQGLFGWRLPAPTELLEAPTALNFLFPGANVPAGSFDAASGDPNSGSFFAGALLNSDGACAASYFSNGLGNCDWDNAPGTGLPGARPWAGQVGADQFSESLVVIAPTPIPATWPLMLTGLTGLGFGAFRKRKGTAVSTAA